MVSTMKNQYLEVCVKSTGAELASIKTAGDGFEYLWQGDPAYWAGQAPVLFPVIGKLENSKYKLENVEYEMEQHGFAYTCEFELVKSEPGMLVYWLQHSAETLRRYPFKFLLEIRYVLEKNTLKTKYAVKNMDDRDMWFSIGAHPAFNCPLEPEKVMEEYVLEFEQREQVGRRFSEDGFLRLQEEVFLDNEKTVKLSQRLFQQRAIVLKGIRSKYVTLQSEKSCRKATVTLERFPFLGIWSPVCGAPFVCIEPWFGVLPTKGRGLDIREKEGIMSIQAGEVFECEFGIIIE